MMTIDPASRLLETVGDSDELGGWCYVVLTRSVFGWLSSPLPVEFGPFFPSEYNVLPVSAIESVEFSRRHALAKPQIRVRLKGSADPCTGADLGAGIVPFGTETEMKSMPSSVRNGFDITVMLPYR